MKSEVIKMFKKSLLATIVSIIVSFSVINVSAWQMSDLPQGENYTVVGVQNNELVTVKTVKNFKSAQSSFEQSIGKYENVLIVSKGTVLQAQYGIVKFNASSACDVNVEFKNALDGSSNYTNGCYGADGAYIGTLENGQVQFKLSGTEGIANVKDLTIIPIEFLNTRLSNYVVKEGNLYHQIKQIFESDFYSAMINLGPAPDYLEADKEYYSYDGHYFYADTNLKVMLDDYKVGSVSQSVNANNPYYNYYQYVTHRTLTNVTTQEFEKYFEETLGISEAIDTYRDLDKDSANDTLTQSQFYKQEQAFFQYQYQYGANALMMLALSMNETSFGRSSLAFTRNNLFGHAAYDSDVEKNASRYFSVHSSIYSHAKYYISGSYSNPLRFQFHGGFFGNKTNGMNVSYASDPYWGEKAAQYYLKIDEIFGYKDFNSETLAIKTSTENVSVYLTPSTESTVIYTTGTMPDFAFVVLEKIENQEGIWYKVQSEATFDASGSVDISYNYDYEKYVGYIKKESIQVVLNEETLKQKEWVSVHFDGNGGVFQDSSTEITYQLEEGSVPAIEKPTKENFYFVDWDLKFKELSEETTYVAQYKEVEKIELSSIPKQNYEINDRIDLKGGKVTIYFKDGKTKEIQLTSSMVSGYDYKVAGDQEVLVRVGGKEISYPITVSQEQDDVRQEIQKEIINLIEKLGNETALTKEQAEEVLTLKLKMDKNMIPFLTQAQIRVLDRLVYLAIDHRIYYVIYENPLNASVSGLSLALPLGTSLNSRFVNDTYKLSIQTSIRRSSLNSAKKVVVGNGYEVKDSFSLSLEKNLMKIEIENPVVISIKKPKNSSSNQLFTVFLIQNGEIIKCNTRQTNEYIQFLAPSTGEFVVGSRNTTNEYVIEDVLENVRADNRDIDLPLLICIGLIAIIVFLGIVMILDRFWRQYKRKLVAKKLQQEEERLELELKSTNQKEEE